VQSRTDQETIDEFLSSSSSLLCANGDQSNMVTFVKAQAYSLAGEISAKIASGATAYSDLSEGVRKSVDHYNNNNSGPQRTKHAVALQVFTEWPFRQRQMMSSDEGLASYLSLLPCLLLCIYIFALFPLAFLMYPGGYICIVDICIL